ncbi:hypothetical protein DPMN_010610 [Dreissena polymorpha]|uniref:Uncharacterized protein n=1 Tax=Dreissena polymorpha TaxID=45954 RepID=A0A9D4N3I2_DREPO|nr:hypothetical protein DPMN_010610 [Dreissena polymorpha]
MYQLLLMDENENDKEGKRLAEDLDDVLLQSVLMLISLTPNSECNKISKSD